MHFGLLGPLEVTSDGHPLDLGRPKQRAVLATLLIHANRVVSLARFADVLWPGATSTRSTGSLPVYIANLRRLVEPDRPARTPPERILTRPPGYVLLVAPGEYDVADFERLAADGNRHLAEGRPRAARRALAEGLSLGRGRALEEFSFAEIEALRLDGLRVAATEDRLEADLLLGAHTAVVAELERLVRDHALRERLVGLLMVALYRSGRQGEALRAYGTARDQLRHELGIEPGRDLRRLEKEILAQAPSLDWRPPPAEGIAPAIAAAALHEPPPARPADAFVGRVAELAALQGALDAGGGGVVMISGEAGIGKTRLVEEALTRSRAGVVAWGRCEEGDGASPLRPWMQVIRGLLEHPDVDAVRSALRRHGAELAQLVPEVKELTGPSAPPPPPLEPAAARYRFFDAVAGVLGRLCEARPLVVVLDDIHWADAPSLQLTEHVARMASGSRLRVVATYRDLDPAPHERLTGALAGLARMPGLLHLHLVGLSEDEVARYIAHEAGLPPAPGVVASVWSRAAGNPFFVTELTRLLVAEKAPADGVATAEAVPWAVRQVVARRLARLPDATRQLLTVAAAAGTEFDLKVVAVAAGVDLGRALDLVDVAVAAGVVKEQPGAAGRLVFSHALVQEALYADATRLRRARLHALLADALEQVSGAPG